MIIASIDLQILAIYRPTIIALLSHHLRSSCLVMGMLIEAGEFNYGAFLSFYW